MQKKRIIIMGGGISGLALAHYLAKRKDLFDIHLFEKQQQAGGWMDSDASTGFFFEKGPRVFRTSRSAAFLSLIADIGMEKEVVPSNPRARGRYIWKEGKLRKMPILSWGLIKGVFKELRTKPEIGNDESVWEFACRRFNSQVAQDIFDPMVRGIYGGDMQNISVKFGLPQFKALEEKYGSVIKGLFKAPKEKGPRLFSLQRGTRSFIKRLEDSLPVHFHYDEEVQAISKKEAYEVQTSKGIYQADYLFSALPCQIIGKLLLPQLLNIPLVGTTVINLGYHKKVINKKGFGYMVSSAEKEPVLGVVFDSNSFTQLNRSPQETRLTVMLQGIEYSEKEAREIALKAVKKHLKISSLPDVSLVRHAPAVFPQFNVGFGELMQDVEKTIEQKYPGFYLAGNYIQGAGVSDCIARAASVVDIFLRATVS